MNQTENVMTELQYAAAFGAMLECALWSSIEWDSGEPFDSAYDISDIADATRVDLIADLEAFIDSNADDIVASGLSPEQIGHDFWLTRNHHGCGYWDRGLGAVGERLTKATHPYGSVDLYLGDDGSIYA